ncbi:lycopene cyclase domain-containing protein [Isoptericola sp. BMS4]|uniref:lycopene cyclase domain-containing protein n=1 Tax=Isoptericola sp. BMS4 TaxID=2527875 RepID=UPI00142490AE|nr:lycopene cyclase domain-containing protein [Isoptericola sp. BMS4]
MRWLYLACLLVSVAGTAAVDRRWRLFAFATPRRAAVTVACGVVFFLLADLAAIALGFYGRGGGAALSGIEVLPHLPIEEVVFVTFLCYLTMVLWGVAERFGARRSARARREQEVGR